MQSSKVRTTWSIKSRLVSFKFFGTKSELEHEMASLADDIDSAGKKSVSFEVRNTTVGSSQQWTVTKSGLVKN